MDETVSEMQRRLRPEHLRREARHAVSDTVRNTAQKAGNNMLETVKENPIPSIIAGLSVGWLVAKSTDSSEQRYYGRDYYENDYQRARARRYGEPHYRERYGPVGYDGEFRHEEYEDYEGGSNRSSVKEQASEAADRARERASEAADQARETAQRSQETAQRYSRRARRRAQGATNQVGRWIENNPLTAGAATLALGAFAGLALPGTRREDELMGETRDHAVRQAKSTAEEAAQRAQHVAKETGKEAKETAKKEAKKEKEKMKSSS
jgi:ElaB/YqjD/DUF883 family membrane-anchored ribosome-binding protein